MTRICPRTRKPKWFLYEIVSNKRSGIDCDKFDYFARDCANVGVKSNFDCRRYFQNVRILLVDEQLQLCVRDKEVFNLYELFHTRWSLHHRVYKHKTQAPIEDLLVQAFLKVDEVCHISESIQDMERYTDLTDSVMYDILRKESTESNVVEAKELLRRIQRRDLYKFCGQTQPESEVKRKADPQTQPGSEVKCGKADTQTQPGSEVEWKADKIAQELASLSKSALKAEQVFVSIVNIHFGMKDKDPVDAVVFYNKSYQPHEVTKEQVSQMLPQKFRERYVRVYAKSREDSELIQQCFKEWCSDNGYPVPVPHMLEGDPSTGYKTTGKSEPASTNASDPADEGAGKSSDKVARALEPEFDEIIDLA